MIKINKLEIENVKRVRAVKIEPAVNGLTLIGGRNNQGKTSVLDGIAWALGGNRYQPSQAQRDGSTIPPRLHTNALSRQFEISVCDECGTDEALAVMANNPLRPEDWAVAISQREVYPEVLQGED